MEEQMNFAFMQQGGVLKDDGMNRDPVSGNEVPSGSMAKEVRDDIDAKLSEGEYVVPADVVRFHGVQKFEELRNQAKQGFGRMEKDGRIGGQPVDDDFPIPMDQLQTFDEGGDTSTYEQTFGQPFTMGQRYGSMGAPQNRGYELITYTSPDGKRTIVIPHFNGKPMSAVPTGFTEQGGAGATAGGSGVGMTDDEDRIDDMEAQRLRNIDQPVTIDPLMQAQLDKDRQLTQPKAVESFTGKDFADYYNQTQGFGIDDIARNVPLLGGLMSMQDDNIRKAALKGLQDGTLDIGSEDEFNAIKSLVTTAPQQSFLSKLFGAREDFTAPTGLPETFADYNKGKPIGADLGPDKFVMDYGFVPTTANTKAELDDLPANTILSPDNATNIIRDMGKNMPFKGTMSENISKAMLGIREKEKVDPITKEKKTVAVVNSPEGEKELDAKTMRGFVNNAETIQQSVLDLTAGKRADGSPDTSRPIGSGPPSVEEIFNELHGFDKGGLASKPKPKPKRKRTTKKGLGVKTKAT
jgi:hypothetical protein